MIAQRYLPQFPNTIKVVTEAPDHIQSAGPLSHLEFSPDGKMLITCSGEGVVHIHGTNGCNLLPEYQTFSHPDGITLAKLSHNNHFLHCLTSRGALVFGAVAAQVQFHELHSTGISDFDIHQHKLVACCQDGYIKIWSETDSAIDHFTLSETILIQMGTTLGKVMIANNEIVAVSENCTSGVHVSIVNITSNEVIRTHLYTNFGSVNALSFTDAGDYLAVAASPFPWGKIYICSKVGEQCNSKQIVSSASIPTDIVWLKGKNTVCVGYDDGTVTLWDTQTGQMLAGPLYHGEGSCKVAISPDGSALATGTRADEIKIWDTEALQGWKDAPINDIPQNHTDTLSIQDFKYQSGEWILGPNNEALLWLPKWYRDENSPRSIPKYATKRMQKRLDPDQFVHGEKWVDCILHNSI